jgi:nicotinamide phosphoribosyltransferase
MKLNPIHAVDFYKTNRIKFHEEGTDLLYENFTPRSVKYLPKIEGIDDKIVLFGAQYFIKYFLIDLWNTEFFQKPKEQVIKKYKRRMDSSLGEGIVDVKHIEELHDLGYLPLKIKAIPEGNCVNAGVPFFTIRETKKGYFWLVNYIEDALSNLVWPCSTSATIARRYKLISLKYAKQTCDDVSFVDYSLHDFQVRGNRGMQDACMSGAGHLLSLTGTDNIPAIDFLEDYYNADCEKEYIGGGVIANEHACVCAGKKENEFLNYKKWITQTFPSGILSLVSDTWNLWRVVTEYLPSLKEDIMKRDGKVVIRPDSSPKTPLEIICGDPEAPVGTPQNKGCVQLLWEIFGGSVNNKGYKELHPSIGLIYGEAISMPLLDKILARLQEMGFASNTCFFGIGSGAYLYGITRDTLSWACKATAGSVNGEFREMFKDPITDSGMKKSAKGLLRVDKINGEFTLKDQCTWEEESGGELIPVFENGNLVKDWTLAEIRSNLAQYV